jgi:hypothetical protein
MFHLLLEAVLLEFEYSLAIHTFSDLQEQFKHRGDWNQVLVVQLYVFISEFLHRHLKIKVTAEHEEYGRFQLKGDLSTRFIKHLVLKILEGRYAPVTLQLSKEPV